MFHAEERFVPFEKKIWLSSPTMHGPELEYIKDAYEKNWMSTVGENINEVERLACETVGCKYAVALATGTNRSSMLQDVTRKGITEIKIINGAVVKEGKAAGVPTPYNEAIVDLILAKQDSYLQK